MNYEQALDYIHGTYKFGSKLGLENITGLLHRLGDPHRKFKSIHVGGTNGKGSVTSLLTHVLIEEGYKVGMFISPYLERFTERIQVNLKEIQPDELARITAVVKTKVDEMLMDGMNHPTEFEIVTAIGFVYFAEQQVDYAVVEVGLGGRLDATNVLDPIVSVITSISYDHMAILGNTLDRIAYEKAGIIKPGRPAVSYPQAPEAMEVLRNIAQQRNAPLYEVDSDGIVIHSSDIERQTFDYTFGGSTYSNVDIRMTGRHQVVNAATALTALTVLKQQGVKITNTSIYNGMKKAVWPGRIEILKRQPYIIIDGAHNANGAQALARALKEYFAGRQVIMVISVSGDKEADAILKELCPLAESVIVTRYDGPRAMDPCQLADRVKYYFSNHISVEYDVEKAIQTGLEMVRPDGVLLFTGSLFLIGMIRSFFGSHR